ncbi:MAG: RHS repeat protein, partial [Proteobacteria bacterium]|nr:RHS repeat protein [Pseudomonadota bacterium]
NCRIMAYDALNRLAMVIDDPMGPIGSMVSLDPRCTKRDGLDLSTRYEYDAGDNLIHQYDADNNHVEFTYDSLNRKTRHIQHKSMGNLETRFTAYDAEGNLTEKIDPENRTFLYEYDVLNRLTSQNFPTTGSPYRETTHVTTQYDANNNVEKITEFKTGDGPAADVTINTHDDFDRLSTSEQRGLTIQYLYDNNGNRTQVSTPTGQTDYTYDSRNRIETAEDQGGITRYEYFPDGKKARVAYPNTTEIHYAYTDSNRIRTIENIKPVVDAEISKFSYENDKNGNILKKNATQNGTLETTIYTYDSLDRLVKFTLFTPEKTQLTEYTFHNYNRKTEVVSEGETTQKSRTYYYDETQWLTLVEDDADVENPFNILYFYDKNGNTISKIDG